MTILQLILMGLVSFLVLSCSDKVTNNYTIMDDGNSPLVKVQVFGWRCDVGDFVNNMGGPGKFNSSSNKARIILEYINGNEHAEYTDDSSMVQVHLPYGPYQIIVETAYTWPDTFRNFAIPRDTMIRLDLVYDVLRRDSVYVRFYYSPIGDSLGYQQELSLLSQLSINSGYVFHPYPRVMVRQEAIYIRPSDGWMSVYYRIPIATDHGEIQTYQAIDAVQGALEAGRGDGTFPSVMNLTEVGYICLD